MDARFSCEASPRRGGHVSCGRLLLAAALLAAPTAAYAQSAPGGAQAQRELQEARLLVARKQWAEACDHFAEADRLDPKPPTEVAVAQCLEKAGRPASALAEWQKLLASAKAKKQKGFELAAAAGIKALAPKVPSLQIVVPAAARVPGLSLRLDRAPLDPTSWGAPLPLDPGSHSVDASAPDHRPWSTTVQVAATGASQVSVPVLDPIPKASAPPPPATALQAVGDARWTEGAGFVRPGDAPPADAATSEPPALPAFANEELGGIGARFEAGAVLLEPSVHGQALPQSLYAPILRLTIRRDYRERTSLVVPWFDVGARIGLAFDKEVNLAVIGGGGGHFGLDLHPFRQHWLAIGAFGGYRLTLWVPRDESTSDVPLPDYSIAVEHGPDVGGHIHLRSGEHAGSPPAVDLDLYVDERATMEDAATYVGAAFGAGGSTRFIAHVDWRAARQGVVGAAPDRTAFDAFALSLPERLQVTIGIGGDY